MNQQQQGRRTLYAIAYGFDIFITVCLAFLIITMAWTIPMTIATNRAMNDIGTDRDHSHIALGICHLFFLGLISGILILCAQGNNQNYYQDQNNNAYQNNNPNPTQSIEQ